MKQLELTTISSYILHPFFLLFTSINILDELISIIGIFILGESWEANIIFLFLLDEASPWLFLFYWIFKTIVVMGFSIGVILTLQSLFRSLLYSENKIQYYMDSFFLKASIILITVLTGFILTQPILWTSTMLIGKSFMEDNFHIMRNGIWLISSVLFMFVYLKSEFWLPHGENKRKLLQKHENHLSICD